MRIRLLWPGWCGLPVCPEPVPARLAAAEPRLVARLDPLLAEELAPGSSRAVAAARRLVSACPGVAAGRWSISLEGGYGRARLEAVECAEPGRYVVLRLDEALRLGAVSSAARRLARLASVSPGEALGVVEEALRRLAAANSVDEWIVEPPAPAAGLGEASEAYAALSERLVNPPLGVSERPLRLAVVNPDEPRLEGLDDIFERLESMGARMRLHRDRRGAGGEPRVVRGVVARSQKPALLRLLVDAVEEGWAPFTMALVDWEPREPAVFEIHVPGQGLAVQPLGLGQPVTVRVVDTATA